MVCVRADRPLTHWVRVLDGLVLRWVVIIGMGEKAAKMRVCALAKTAVFCPMFGQYSGLGAALLGSGNWTVRIGFMGGFTGLDDAGT